MVMGDVANRGGSLGGVKVEHVEQGIRATTARTFITARNARLPPSLTRLGPAGSNRWLGRVPQSVHGYCMSAGKQIDLAFQSPAKSL